jgi:hypothetical protein
MKMSRPSARERKRAASCPRTLFPARSSGGAKGGEASLARGDGDDAAADAALAREADVVEPVAGALVQPGGGHHGEGVAARVLR